MTYPRFLCRVSSNRRRVSSLVFLGVVVIAIAASTDVNPASTLVAGSFTQELPTITWTPAPLQAGEVTGPAQLNASANTPGSFAYSCPSFGTPSTPCSGLVVQAGWHVMIVTFTPDDSVNFRETSTTGVLKVTLHTARSSPAPEPSLPFGTLYDGVFDAAADRLYMIQQFYTPARIAVIRASTNEILEYFTPSVLFPRGLAIDAAGQRLLTIDPTSATLAVIDLTTKAIVEEIPVGSPSSPPVTLAFNPSTRRLYVGSRNQVDVVNLNLAPGAAGRLSTVATDGFLNHLVVNSSSNLIYFQSFLGPCPVRVLEGDPAKPQFNQVLATIPLGSGCDDVSLAVNRQTGRLYVAAYWDFAIKVIDGDRSSPTFNTIVEHISLVQPQQDGVGPIAVTTDPVTNRIYVYMAVGDGPHSVLVMDGATSEVLSITMLPFDEHQDGPEHFGQIFVNPSTANVYATGVYTTSVLKDRVAEVLTTSDSGLAEPVVVANTNASITFSDVTSGGTTTVAAIDAADLNLSVPGQFTIAGALAYEITTTASVVPPISLCFNAGSVEDPEVFASLRVLHGENGGLVDRTSSRDFAAGIICAEVDSLSPFVIVAGARGAVQRLIKKVNEAGLTRGQNQSLTAKLAAAVKQLDNGNSSSARLQVEAFSNELRALANTGRVSAAIADPLLAAAAELAAKL